MVSKRRSVRCRPLSLAMACAGLGSAGCQGPRIDPAAELAVAEAAGVSAAAVVFKSEGGPVDEPVAAGERLAAADAVQRAVSTSPSLQAALARVRVAMADADQAR